MASVARKPEQPEPIGGDVIAALNKDRAEHSTWKPIWAEALAFLEGRQYVYRMAKARRIDELETREGGAKPRYRARTTRNLYTKHIMAEVSAGVQRVPGYDVVPTTTDPDDVSAARLSVKILHDLYDRLKLRKYLTICRIYSVTCGEGFLRPYWNPRAGKPLPDGLFEGEICMEVYGPDEVFWQAGSRFDRSPYVCVETAKTLAEVKALPGFNGAELQADVKSNTSLVSGQLSRNNNRPDSVLVTEYLELPTEKYPLGRRAFFANDKQITATENYPMPIRGESGYEHCIHAMPYIPTPHRDRDLGLGTKLADAQRVINDVINKAIQWKNLAIKPQIMAPVNSIIDRLTDEEGAIIRYRPIGGYKPEWRTPPPIPESLFRMKDDAVRDMQDIASQHSLPPGVESGKGLDAVYQQDQSVTAFIIEAIADFHAQLGRHLLHYAQRYYTHERLLQLSGKYAPDAAFIGRYKGADIREQTNVRVSSASVEPRTRQAMEAKVFAMVDRQMIAPEVGTRAIEGGYAESLIADYELDIAKQHREIDDMVLMGVEELPGGDVPIAAAFDNHEVHLDELHRWMKTKDFEDQPEPVKLAATLHEQQHKAMQAGDEAQIVAAQTAVAEERGRANAARPSGKPMPSAPQPMPA